MDNPEKLATLDSRQMTKTNKTKNTTQKIKEMNNSNMLDITMRKHTQKI